MKEIWLIAAPLAFAAVPVAAQQHGQHHGAPAAGHAAPAAQENHAHAHGEEQRAIMAVVDRMFAALAAKDKAALLAEVVPEGRATANLLGARREVVSESWPVFAEHLARIPGQPAERLIDPHVHVEGDIAMIWSRYEFELDGRFSHCGIDHFDLIRQNGRWRVLNLTWTQQRENCPGRSSGPSGDRG